jgi:hypothetical protein
VAARAPWRKTTSGGWGGTWHREGQDVAERAWTEAAELGGQSRFEQRCGGLQQVKRAEGDAEAKHLTGVDVVRQRQAIVDGLCHFVPHERSVPAHVNHGASSRLLVFPKRRRRSSFHVAPRISSLSRAGRTPTVALPLPHSRVVCRRLASSSRWRSSVSIRLANYILHPSYRNRAGQTLLSLTRFIENISNIYIFK